MGGCARGWGVRGALQHQHRRPALLSPLSEHCCLLGGGGDSLVCEALCLDVVVADVLDRRPPGPCSPAAKTERPLARQRASLRSLSERRCRCARWTLGALGGQGSRPHLPVKSLVGGSGLGKSSPLRGGGPLPACMAPLPPRPSSAGRPCCQSPPRGYCSLRGDLDRRGDRSLRGDRDRRSVRRGLRERERRRSYRRGDGDLLLMAAQSRLQPDCPTFVQLGMGWRVPRSAVLELPLDPWLEREAGGPPPLLVLGSAPQGRYSAVLQEDSAVLTGGLRGQQ